MKTFAGKLLKSKILILLSNLMGCIIKQPRKVPYAKTEDLWTDTELTERDWKLILTGAGINEYQPGDVVLEAGIPNHSLHRIMRGSVRVEKDIDGTPKVLTVMEEGDVFGEMSLVIRGV